MRRLNRTDAERNPLSDELRRRLVAYFEEDVRLLEELTGRDLSRWLA